MFLQHINRNFYRNDFELKGSSNYAFPLILKSNYKNRNILEKTMKTNKIEFRRGNAGGGNQLRQPYLKNYLKKVDLKDYKQVDHIHFLDITLETIPRLNQTKSLNYARY